MENPVNTNVPQIPVEPTPQPIPEPTPAHEPLQIAETKSPITLPVIIGGILLVVAIVGGIVAYNYLKPQPQITVTSDKPSIFKDLVITPTPVIAPESSESTESTETDINLN